jgi:quercetin dioxygenase-like cupin family protein
MPGRVKGRTLVARDEGDRADDVVIKLYGEETNGVISIIEQPFEPGFLLPPHVHENDVWLYVLEGRCTLGSATRSSRRHPVAGC